MHTDLIDNPRPSHLQFHRNEEARVMELLEFDLDYSSLEDDFEDLVRLAATVAGTEVCLLNLIDMYTEWIVSGHGFATGQVPRENTVCQYTILEPEHFEVKNLAADERFKDFGGIKDAPHFRYYFGIPLKTPKGNSIGTLCVLDTIEKDLTSEKIAVLKTIAGEIIKRLTTQKHLQALRRELSEVKAINQRVAHDIRGPIGGIVGLADMLIRKNGKNSLDEVLRLSQLISKSGSSLLALADEIMGTGEVSSQSTALNECLTLGTLKEKLEQLYQPQATEKGICFDVSVNEELCFISFSKNKLMQITGNLISNALKFTPPLGDVSVYLDLTLSQNHRILYIRVKDTGIGLTEHQIAAITGGRASSTTGTKGELGYGMGLQLVKHLVDNLQGSMQVEAAPNQGAQFEIRIPIGMIAHLS
ncbi:GAF domain-containing sensor histidine kinase [Pontibacter sp. JH31]|uniref:histidine kinase n=1 Tax=Pontibacter aquaedesilientis TaxID=2766980 RepID=A0ABR7XDS9_9BACT|nr:GAF domain-containing sensor histidine kinase [Pontibacter aquaedesilientis]MBD1396432.1 GAF domain-containing sensor histidine kinase [Pontibacter aquaedesilientis]